MVSIYSLQRLMDRYWSNQNELSMVLVHIEKAYNKVPREILWKDLEGKKKKREKESSYCLYFQAFEDMNNGSQLM